MNFEVVPSSGPEKIDGGATSPLFDFLSPDLAAETGELFLRFIALWRDNEPLGGEAPTFQIRAGGVITSVGPDAGDVAIPDGRNQTVGSVNCVRLESDIYLLRISDVVENSGPWKIRIRNNDHETLGFLGFVSKKEQDTLQPWAVIDGSPLRFNRFRSTTEIQVRNWGTAPLLFGEGSGTPLGGRDSPVKLDQRPDRVEPHGVGAITIVADAFAGGRTLEHHFLWNDARESHGRITIEIEPEPSSGGHRGPGTDPENSRACKHLGCGCVAYLSGGPHGDCRRPICRHGNLEHEFIR